MGLAAAWTLSRRGLRVVVLERHGIVHDHGSHGGRTRVFRHAYSEGPEYVPLMLAADERWCELEKLTGVDILYRTGILEMELPGSSFVRDSAKAAASHSIPYELVDASEIRYRWPQFRPGDDWQGGFSDRAGFVDVEAGLRSMATLSVRAGTTIELGESATLTGWSAGSDEVVAHTPGGDYRARYLVLTSGAGMARLLEGIHAPLTLVNKTLHWFDLPEPAQFTPDRFPVFAAVDPVDAVYGFPVHAVPGLKAANHSGGDPSGPTGGCADRRARRCHACPTSIADVVAGCVGSDSRAGELSLHENPGRTFHPGQVSWAS